MVFVEIVRDIVAGLQDEFDVGVFHVTQVTQCLRKSYYIHRYGDVLDEHVREATVRGRAVHFWLERMLVERGYADRYGIVVEKPVEIRVDGVVVVGHVDVIFNDEYVVEIKTSGRRVRGPLHSHLLQVHAYMYATGLRKYCIVYIDPGGVHEYCGDYDESLVDEFIRRARLLIRSVMSGTPPPREITGYCRYCPFYDRCMGQRRIIESTG